MIREQQHDGVRVLSMEFGSANALGPAAVDALNDALATIDSPTVLTGEGRVFSAGLNLVQLDTLDAAGLAWGLFDGVVEDPTDICVDAGLAAVEMGHTHLRGGFHLHLGEDVLISSHYVRASPSQSGISRQNSQKSTQLPT